MTKRKKGFKVLNILFSDDENGSYDWNSVPNVNLLPRFEESTSSITPSKELIDIEIPRKTKSSPAITMPDGTSVIQFEDSKVFDWSDPLSRNLLLDMQVKQESNFNPNAVGADNDMGLGQITPITWETGVKKGWVPKNYNPFDPDTNLHMQQSYMNYLINMPIVKNTAKTSEERYKMALAGYNAGPTALTNAVKKAKKEGRSWAEFIPDSTKQYIAKILLFVQKEKDRYTPRYKREYL